jgi:copper oxidase (laccase) domain-containing protein
VGEDVYTGFCRDFTYAEDLFRQAETFTAARPQLHLDLWEANRRQLLDAGVASESISVTGNDTATDTDRFFSHRTESGLTGRAMAAIGMMA